MNQGPPDFKSSALNHSTTLPPSKATGAVLPATYNVLTLQVSNIEIVLGNRKGLGFHHIASYSSQKGAFPLPELVSLSDKLMF